MSEAEKFLKEYSELERQYNNVEITFDGLCKMLEAYKNQFPSPQVTDEEITTEAEKRFPVMSAEFNAPRNARRNVNRFTDGAKWMREKLTK